MAESDGMHWEDRITNDFLRMTVQDDETGECWPVKLDEPLLGECSPSTKLSCSALRSIKKWRIPQQYSQLGCTPCHEESGDPPTLINNPGDSGSWSCEKEEEAGETVLVAKFPPVGKVPLFGRKRSRPSPPALAEKDITQKCATTDTSSRKKRFLTGRDGIVFLGRLILACLILLSPGYVLPLLFTIRTYCHMWKHGNEDQPEEDIEESNVRVFGFLRSTAFLKYSCRFCRERLQTQKMLRLHSTYGSASSPKFSSRVPAVEEESYCCNCPNH